MKKFCLFLMTCVLVFLALLSTGCSVDDGVSAPNRICYGKKLYYDAVCFPSFTGIRMFDFDDGQVHTEAEYDSLKAYYDGLCARWMAEAYDSTTAMYDQSHYLVDTRERVCLDDVTFE